MTLGIKADGARNRTTFDSGRSRRLKPAARQRRGVVCPRL